MSRLQPHHALIIYKLKKNGHATLPARRPAFVGVIKCFLVLFYLANGAAKKAQQLSN